MSRVEIGYCLFFSSDWGGMGEAGSDGRDPDPGQWYVHHNIFDWRAEKTLRWGGQPHPQDCYTAHSPDGDSPRKIYNNLAIFGPDRQDAEGIGFEHCASTGTSDNPNNLLTGAAMTHQVFNNILLCVHIEGTKRYNPTAGVGYGNTPRIQNDFIGCHKIRYSANETNELTDYNLYWRPSSMTTDPALWYARGSQTGRVGYASLDAWRASAEFQHSKLSGTFRGAYTPAWTATRR